MRVSTKFFIARDNEYLRSFKEYRNHEALYEFVHTNIPEVKLFVAIHNTKLGPGLGGVRAISYPSEKEAIEDALRLSYMMSIKAAFNGVALGGAKSVLFVDKHTLSLNHHEIFRWVGKCIESLGGKYIAAEDMGVSYYDLAAMRETTKHVRGLKEYSNQNEDFDFVSSMTAAGVITALQSALRFKLGDDFKKKQLTYLVQGCVGKVGLSVSAELAKNPHNIIFANDIKNEKEIADAFKCVGIPRGQWRYIKNYDIYRVKHDVFVPCAIGGVVSAKTSQESGVKIIVGSANNQLVNREDAVKLMEYDVLYVPDFVVNAGGLIAVAMEGSDEKLVLNKVLEIENNVWQLCSVARKCKVPPQYLAEARAALRLRMAI